MHVLQSDFARRALVLLGLATLLGLSGCVQYRDGTNLTCPRAVFLGGAETLTRFVPGAAATDDNIAAQIRLSGLQYNCRTSRRDAVATVLFAVAGVRRNAALPGTIDVPYFVAVVDSQGLIIAKQIFTTRLAYIAGVSSVTVRPEIYETLTPAAGLSPVAYEIIVGIQLTPEEFEYNLARK
ncbi:MAG: hypothetical protein EXQ93_01020 [Alphaproteobacteria bacterium]|nr:hypothetical protein [Alphaproteobacteria bacterium]